MNSVDFFKSFPWKNPKSLPKTLPLIKEGNKDRYYVDLIHKQLVASGTSTQLLGKDIVDGVFGSATKNAVVYFQQTHLGPQKNNLSVDGVVGPDTWWALYNSNGDAQKLNLKSDVVSVSGNRAKVLNVAKSEHQKGVAESPKGSNWGDGVSKFLQYIGIGPNPWCCAFCSWVVFTALGLLPWKTKMAHVATFWALAKKLNMAFTINEYSPIPGDFFVIVHSSGQGHIGIVTNVDSDTKCKKFSAIEGNSSDRVALRERVVGIDDHIGYINFYGDSQNRPKFNVGLAYNPLTSGKSETR